MSTDEASPSADPFVVERWVTGWTVARETSPPVPDAGGFRVDVGWPQQRVRYVFPRCSDGLKHLAATLHEPWIFLKVCAPPDSLRALLPPRWVLQPLGFMMTCDEPAEAGDVPLAGEYALSLTARPSVLILSITAASGEVVASGRVALVDDFAIYDRIETHPAHRRRGLGRWVMKTLGDTARARGSHRGVLVATADGRALYQSLGWRMHSLYTTAVIPGPTS